MPKRGRIRTQTKADTAGLGRSASIRRRAVGGRLLKAMNSETKVVP